MTLPNFFIIGAPRCGTSTLYDGVRQHPEIYMSPVKEPWYFSIGVRSKPFQGPKDADYNLYLSRAEYEALFSNVNGEKIVGEASTDYLYSDRALDALCGEFPSAKLVAILRNPADRAYSQYVQHVSQLREPCQRFWDAIELEDERKRLDWCHYWYYRSLGFYGRQLQRYYERVDAGQIKVFLIEDLRSDPAALYRDLFEFLGVDASFEPELQNTARNESALPASPQLHAMLTRPSLIRSIARRVTPRRLRVAGLKWAASRRQNVQAPGLTPDERRNLIEGYRDDIQLLESLIGRDLSSWLQQPEQLCES
jgi:hypothetical protein